MIFVGKIKDYENIENVYIQIYYPKYDVLSVVERPVKDGDSYTDTFNINSEDGGQLGSTRPLIPGDMVTFFFWEGKEDKSEITKLSALTIQVDDNLVQNADMYLLDFTNAFKFTLLKDEIVTYKDVEFDLSQIMEFETNFTYAKIDGNFYYQWYDTMKFFNWKDYLTFELYLNGENIGDKLLLSETGNFTINGVVKIFQFNWNFEIKVTCMIEPPKYLFKVEPNPPSVIDEVDITLKIENDVPNKIKMVLYLNDEPIKTVTEFSEDTDYGIHLSSLPMKFYNTFKIELTYDNGIISNYVDVQEFKVYMKNLPSYIAISNKDAVAKLSDDNRLLKIYMKSYSAKRIKVKWYIQIPDAGDDYIYLYEKTIKEYEDFTQLDDIYDIYVTVAAITGKIKMEIVLEDMFGEEYTDFIEFYNNCNKFVASSTSLGSF